jgi:hypothetical protein
MSKAIGPGENIGVMKLGWESEDDAYVLQFGNTGEFEALIYLDESTGVWMFRIDHLLEDRDVVHRAELFRDGPGTNFNRALNEGTTELVSFLLQTI